MTLLDPTAQQMKKLIEQGKRQRRSVMAFMFEVYYKSPTNPAKESALTERVAALGCRLDFREEAGEHVGVCLTYEFDDLESAAKAADALRQLGEHVEGSGDYEPEEE